VRVVPDLGPTTGLTLPETAERTLANGLIVIAIRRPSVPLVEVRLRIPFARADLPGTSLLTQTVFSGTSQLSTVDIARAWHVPEPTMAQRIVRAKRALAQAKVPFEEPSGDELAGRLPGVLDVVYLIFNEGYLAARGDQLTRPPLAAEAHRLARLLTDLLPAQPQAWALRALIAFHRSRDGARLDEAGNLVTLEHQDRGRWDRVLIGEGRHSLARADGDAPLVLQARLAGYHATAPSFADTDWAGILACYDALLAQGASAVLALNRAVAVAMADGPDRALPLLDALVAEPALARTHRVWSVRADLLRRLGEDRRAAADYDRALALVDNDVERRYLTDARSTLRST